MLPTSMTSKELQELTGYSKAALIEFEQAGLIARSAKDTWPLETVTKLMARLRERKPVVSEERLRWEAARAAREEMKAKKLAGELCYTREFEDAWTEVIGVLLAALVSFPARVTRDLALRGVIERELDRLRNEVCDHFRGRADELSGGKAT